MKLNEKTGLYENYGLWHVPFWQTDKFKLAVQICACVLLLIVIALLVRKYLAYRRRKKLPIWDQALLKLTQLKKDHQVDVAHGKEFYLTVSALLKHYFHERFSYDLLGKTDAEVIECLHEHHFDEHILAELKALLQGSEIIKFANAQAAQEQIEHDYLRAVTIIQRTIPEKKS